MPASGSKPVTADSPSPRSILAAVGFAVFIAADDLTVVTTMLRPIINDLGVVLPDGLDDAAWVVNAYLIAFVAVMPIAGRLSDVFGRRRVFMWAYSLFVVGNVVIPLSSSLNMFLAGRVLTAAGGGAMVPVALAVVGDVYPVERRTRTLGTLAAIETFGWVWGPLYGAVLIRFFNWQTQFWLNIPLSVVGMVWAYWALGGHTKPVRKLKVGWIGAGLLTATLVTLDLGLLGDAEVQSVSGLEELRGTNGFDFWILLPLAAAVAAVFGWQQRRVSDPIFDRSLLTSRQALVAMAINVIVGAALVVAMVDVPIFINAVEGDIKSAAVNSGWLLSSMTAAMALTSYAGGMLSEHHGYRGAIMAGLVIATVSYVAMAMTWDPDSSRASQAIMLGGLGAGLGMTIAPTTSAVVSAARPTDRGSAAASVMVMRLIGFSVGLAALTAWALARFNALRSTIDLPPITDPNYQTVLMRSQQELTADAITETFLATAALTGVGLMIGGLFPKQHSNRPELAPR